MAAGPKTLLKELIDDTWRVESETTWQEASNPLESALAWFADKYSHGSTTAPGFDLVPVDIWFAIYNLTGELGRTDVPSRTKLVMVRVLRRVAEYAQPRVPEGTMEQIRAASGREYHEEE